MAETSKSLRQVLLGTLPSLVVTRAALDAADGLVLDADLLDAAGFLEHEKVDLLDVTNGARLAAPVTAAPRASGEVAVSGAVAQLVRPGDLVTLSSFGWMKEKQAKKHQPQRVVTDAQNRAVGAAAPADAAAAVKPPSPKRAKKKQKAGR